MRVEHIVRTGAERAAARVAVAAGRGRYTYRDLDRQSDRLAPALAARLSQGDRVALHLEDGFPTVVAMFGILKAGTVAAPLDAPASEERLGEWFGRTRAAGVITEARHATAVAAALDASAGVKLAILVGGDRSTAGGTCLAYEDIVTGLAAGEVAAADAGGEAMIFAGPDDDIDAFTHDDIIRAAAIGAPHPDATVTGSAPLATHDGFHEMIRTLSVGATLVLNAARYGRRAERTRLIMPGGAGEARRAASGGAR